MDNYVVEVDALYFQAREVGVQFAVQKNKVLNPDFQTQFGARAKVAFTLPHDNWELWVQFLHFHARTTEEKQGGPFLPTEGIAQLLPEGSAANVRSRWRLHLGFFDALLSRSWCVGEALNLWPLFGARIAGIRHKSRIDYGMAAGVYDLSMKNKFFGGGPYLGANAVWQLTKPVGLFFHAAYSLLVGGFYVHQDEQLIGSGDKFKILDLHPQIQSVWETAVGLDFRMLVTKSCMELFFTASYELYLLFNQNQQLRFPSSSMPGKMLSNQGSLSLNGLSVGLGLNF